ncbi:trehalase-domain-containing protein [Mycena pura]|uniref:Trehalase n=1 Tax=Mycena pura TaxID=153505 RepID=A0AAD6Y5P7_9AGAR|nr:trehalase-domain-containing protein [Mycena pura]
MLSPNGEYMIDLNVLPHADGLSSGYGPLRDASKKDDYAAPPAFEVPCLTSAQPTTAWYCSHLHERARAHAAHRYGAVPLGPRVHICGYMRLDLPSHTFTGCLVEAVLQARAGRAAPRAVRGVRAPRVPSRPPRALTRIASRAAPPPLPPCAEYVRPCEAVVGELKHEIKRALPRAVLLALSFWIVEGLLESQPFSIANDTLQNELERFRFIVNGGRIYYLNRSRQTLFIQMVARYVRATARRGASRPPPPRVVHAGGRWMQRIFRRQTAPLARAARSRTRRTRWRSTASRVPPGYVPPPPLLLMLTRRVMLNDSASAALYAELASGAETGWDFSWRWLAGVSAGLRSLNIKNMIPVDLSSILYKRGAAVRREQPHRRARHVHQHGASNRTAAPVTFINTGADAPNAWPPHQCITLRALPANVSGGPLPMPAVGQGMFSLVPAGELGVNEATLPVYNIGKPIAVGVISFPSRGALPFLFTCMVFSLPLGFTEIFCIGGLVVGPIIFRCRSVRSP